MIEFQPDTYGPQIAALLEGIEACEIGPGSPHEQVRGQLQGLNADQLLPDARVKDRSMAQCCVAGLWLLHNFLDESHRISQDVATTSGSFWHGIMHRREGDFGNAKYWFQRVGEHPVYEPLSSEARQIALQSNARHDAQWLKDEEWDAFQFVDLCELVWRGKPEYDALCRQLAWAEWQLLFDHCFRRAFAK